MASGWKAIEINIDSPTLSQDLNSAKRNNARFAIGISGVGSDIKSSDGRLAWEILEIPFFTWYCDHPAYYPSRHRERSPWIIQSYVFPDHAKYSKKYVNTESNIYAFHWGIPISLRRLIPEKIEKINALIFPKSCGDPVEIKSNWRRRYSPLFQEYLFDLANTLRHKTVSVYPEIISRYLEERGVFWGPGDDKFLAIVRELDGYHRSMDATELVLNLRNSGIQLHIYGNGWSHIDTDEASNVKIFPALTAEECFRRIATYVGCLSTNPLVEESAHDRVFASIGLRTVPITRSNRFIKDYFGEQIDISTVHNDEIEKKIKELLKITPEQLAKLENSYREKRLPTIRDIPKLINLDTIF